VVCIEEIFNGDSNIERYKGLRSSPGTADRRLLRRKKWRWVSGGGGISLFVVFFKGGFDDVHYSGWVLLINVGRQEQ
jgi:hypothetical protein